MHRCENCKTSYTFFRNALLVISGLSLVVLTIVLFGWSGSLAMGRWAAANTFAAVVPLPLIILTGSLVAHWILKRHTAKSLRKRRR